jgi:rhamnosyltransferase subunit B
MQRIVIATLGSLGDLFPMLAIAEALEGAGTIVTFASNPIYRDHVVKRGISFCPLGSAQDPTDVPSRDDCDDTSAFVEHINFSQLDQLYDDLLAAAESMDAIVAPYFVLPAHLAAEKLGIPYVACAPSPAYFIPTETLTRMSLKPRRGAPPRWQAQLRDLRKRKSLSSKSFPYAAMLENSVAMLGLFPAFLAEGSSPALARIKVVGFPHLETREPSGLDQTLRNFCDERTVLFSFGSFVDRRDPLHFFAESVAACKSLNLKCVYLSRYAAEIFDGAGEEVLTRAYVNHDILLPHVAAVVHHGGLGSLMAACRHAKPMIIVPFLYDQPYHAARMAEIIDAPVLPASQYDRTSLRVALERVLECREEQCDRLSELMSKDCNGARNAAREILAAVTYGRTPLGPASS